MIGDRLQCFCQTFLMDSVRKTRKLDPSGRGRGVRSHNYPRDVRNRVYKLPTVAQDDRKPPPPPKNDIQDIPDSWESILTDDSDTETGLKQSPQRTVISLNPQFGSVSFSKVVPEDSPCYNDVSDQSIEGTVAAATQAVVESPLLPSAIPDLSPDPASTIDHSLPSESDFTGVNKSVCLDDSSRTDPENSSPGSHHSGCPLTGSAAGTPQATCSATTTRQLNPFERAIVSVAEHSFIGHLQSNSQDLNVSRKEHTASSSHKEVTTGLHVLNTKSSHGFRTPRVLSQFRHGHAVSHSRAKRLSAGPSYRVAPVEVSISMKDISSGSEPLDNDDSDQLENSTGKEQDSHSVTCSQTVISEVTIQDTHKYIEDNPDPVSYSWQCCDVACSPDSDNTCKYVGDCKSFDCDHGQCVENIYDSDIYKPGDREHSNITGTVHYSSKPTEDYLECIDETLEPPNDTTEVDTKIIDNPMDTAVVHVYSDDLPKLTDYENHSDSTDSSKKSKPSVQGFHRSESVTSAEYCEVLTCPLEVKLEVLTCPEEVSLDVLASAPERVEILSCAPVLLSGFHEESLEACDVAEEYTANVHSYHDVTHTQSTTEDATCIITPQYATQGSLEAQCSSNQLPNQLNTSTQGPRKFIPSNLTTNKLTISEGAINIVENQFSLNNSEENCLDTAAVDESVKDNRHVNPAHDAQRQCVQYPSVQNVQYNIPEYKRNMSPCTPLTPDSNTDVDYISDDDNLTWEDPVIASTWPVNHGESTSDSDADEFFSLDSGSEDDSGHCSVSCATVSTVTGVTKATGHAASGASNRFIGHHPASVAGSESQFDDRCRDVVMCMGTDTKYPVESVLGVVHNEKLPEDYSEKAHSFEGYFNVGACVGVNTTDLDHSNFDIPNNSIKTITRHDLVSDAECDTACTETSVPTDMLFMDKDYNTSTSESLLPNRDCGIDKSRDYRVLMAEEELSDGDYCDGKQLMEPQYEMCPVRAQSYLNQPILSEMLDSCRTSMDNTTDQQTNSKGTNVDVENITVLEKKVHSENQKLGDNENDKNCVEEFGQSECELSLVKSSTRIVSKTAAAAVSNPFVIDESISEGNMKINSTVCQTPGVHSMGHVDDRSSSDINITKTDHVDDQLTSTSPVDEVIAQHKSHTQPPVASQTHSEISHTQPPVASQTHSEISHTQQVRHTRKLATHSHQWRVRHTRKLATHSHQWRVRHTRKLATHSHQWRVTHTRKLVTCSHLKLPAQDHQPVMHNPKKCATLNLEVVSV